MSYWVWAVWEAEYPEDGVTDVVAMSHWEAKRKYLGEVWDRAYGQDSHDAPALRAKRLRIWKSPNHYGKRRLGGGR